MCVCVDFGEMVALGGGSPKCQNGACDIDHDIENEVKVQTAWKFNWAYLRHILTQNQMLAVLRTHYQYLSILTLRSVNDKGEIDRLTLRFEEIIFKNDLSRLVYVI